MQITQFSARNYKSIRSLEPFDLSNGFNIVTGQNASGKTALLELLSLNFSFNPHRSLATVPNPGDVTDGYSRCHALLKVLNEELKRIVKNSRQTISIPVPPTNSPVVRDLDIRVWDQDASKRFLQLFLTLPEYIFELTFNNGAAGIPQDKRFSLHFDASKSDANNITKYIQFIIQPDGKWVFRDLANVPNDTHYDFGSQIADLLKQYIYRFSSERTVQARAPHGDNAQLLPNAANLPEVLNILQGNAAVFQEFNDLVSEVLPQVRWVSIRALPTLHEVVVWSHDRNTRRNDLAVPLDQTGSGVAQVLAILYVVATTHEAKTIIIDEPQSFLHPASAIKLIEVLKRYQRHQFILATHSPSIIAAAHPKNILLLNYDNETRLEVFDLHKANSFNIFLNNAGLQLQDVFGADNILWVEGPTEHQIFPFIIEYLTEVQLMGTTIAPVRATGDLEGRDAARVFEIYRTLTRGNALLPPALAFILDREDRSDQQLREVIKQSDNKARFLGRRTFENYLLNPAAIIAVMNSIEGFRDQPVLEEELARMINEKRKDKKYFAPFEVSEEWEKNVHAPNLLKDLFGELSDQRVQYRKPDHSVMIGKWLLEHSPNDLLEVANLLRLAFGRQ